MESVNRSENEIGIESVTWNVSGSESESRSVGIWSERRAGRANPSILDGVMVNYYGADTPLKQLATISIPEARQIMIKPFDRSCLSLIEKGIYEANNGLTPNNNGEIIILNIPALTETTRRDYVKQAKQIAEEGKIALRNVRQDANNDIKKSEATEEIGRAHV